MRRRTPLVLICAALLAACSSGPSVELGEGSMERLDSSPLSEFYTSVYGEVTLTQDEEAAQQRSRQLREADLTAECMAAQGFSDYVPWFPGMGLTATTPEEDPSLDPLERATQWGYGVFTSTAPIVENPDAYIDPNQAVMQQMSDAERSAFWRTLVEGDGSGPDANGRLDQADGCVPWASEEVNEIDPRWERGASAFSDPRFAELDRAIQDISTTVAESTALADANRAWSDCMGQDGYDYASPEAAEAHFTILGGEIESRTSDEAKAVAADEIATAVSDQQCRSDTNYDETVQQITWNAEQQILDLYADDITALLGAIQAN